MPRGVGTGAGEGAGGWVLLMGFGAGTAGVGRPAGFIKKLMLVAAAVALAGCDINPPPGQKPNQYIHQLGLEGGGG